MSRYPRNQICLRSFCVCSNCWEGFYGCPFRKENTETQQNKAGALQLGFSHCMNIEAPLAILRVTSGDPGSHCYLRFIQLPPDRKEQHPGRPQHSELPPHSHGRTVSVPSRMLTVISPGLVSRKALTDPESLRPSRSPAERSSTSLLEFLSFPRDEQGPGDSGGGPGASRGQCPSGRYSGNIPVTLDSAAQEGRFLLAPSFLWAGG